MAETWLAKAFDLVSRLEDEQIASGKKVTGIVPAWDVNAYRTGYGSDYITHEDGSIEKVTRNSGPITRADAGRDLARQLPDYGARVKDAVGQDVWDALPDETKASMVSAAYNYGTLPASVVATAKQSKSPFDIALAIKKLGQNKGINNPERRSEEAVYALSYMGQQPANPAAAATTAQGTGTGISPAPALSPAVGPGLVNKVADTTGSDMAQPKADPFGAAFGNVTPKVAPADPAKTGDAFGAAFGKAAKPTAAATPPAPVAATPQPKGSGNALFDFAKKSISDMPMIGPAIKGVEGVAGMFGVNPSVGAARGFQDVGDTVSNAGMTAAKWGSQALADRGLIDPSLAKGVGNAADQWDKTTEEGRKAWDAAHPATSTAGGLIPTDANSWFRMGGQMAATAPVLGPAGKVALEGAGLITGNPLVRDMIAGAATNVGQAALTSRASDQPVNEQLLNAGVLGGLFGPAGRIVLKAGGKVGSFFANMAGKSTDKGYDPKAVEQLAGWLKEIGLTPEEANKKLQELGPDATYADLDASLRSKAAALAGMGGEPTSTLKTAFGERKAAGPDRTSAQMDTILGPAPDVTAAIKGIEEEASKTAGPHYKNAYSSTQTYDLQPVVDYIDERLKTAKGGTAQTLKNAKELLYTLDDERKAHLDNSIPQMHAARVELDRQINALSRSTSDTTAASWDVGAAKDVRSKLDEVLKQNPDMAAGDKAYAGVIKTKESFETGQDVFKNSTRPEDLQRLVDNATPEQLTALRAGARAAINDTLQNTARGELVATDTLFGKKSTNRAKLAILFPQEADDVLNLVQGNATMRETENKILSPSATAELRTAQDDFKAKPRNAASWMESLAVGVGAGSHFGMDAGLAAGTAMRIATGILDKLEAKGITVTKAEAARILSASEAQRREITNALAKNATKSALTSILNKVATGGARVTQGTSQQSNDSRNALVPAR